MQCFGYKLHTAHHNAQLSLFGPNPHSQCLIAWFPDWPCPLSCCRLTLSPLAACATKDSYSSFVRAACKQVRLQRVFLPLLAFPAAQRTDKFLEPPIGSYALSQVRPVRRANEPTGQRNEDRLCVKILSNDLFTNSASRLSLALPCSPPRPVHAESACCYPALAAVAFSTHLSAGVGSVSASAPCPCPPHQLWTHIFQCSWLDFVFLPSSLRSNPPRWLSLSLFLFAWPRLHFVVLFAFVPPRCQLNVFILCDLMFIISALVNRTHVRQLRQVQSEPEGAPFFPHSCFSLSPNTRKVRRMRATEAACKCSDLVKHFSVFTIFPLEMLIRVCMNTEISGIIIAGDTKFAMYISVYHQFQYWKFNISRPKPPEI